ncbi:hypothetical protein [Rummeliibacillus stabekisii]|uniref:hypothetical protein n=1 Tax=Rummeliibacillus stabekisii TaxID=241244 RepID=UPI003712F04C
MEELSKKKSKNYRMWYGLNKAAVFFLSLMVFVLAYLIALIAFYFTNNQMQPAVIGVFLSSMAFLYTNVKVIILDLEKRLEKKMYVPYVPKVKVIKSKTNLEKEINEFLSKAKENYYRIIEIEALTPQSSIVHFLSPVEELNNEGISNTIQHKNETKEYYRIKNGRRTIIFLSILIIINLVLGISIYVYGHTWLTAIVFSLGLILSTFLPILKLHIKEMLVGKSGVYIANILPDIFYFISTVGTVAGLISKKFIEDNGIYWYVLLLFFIKDTLSILNDFGKFKELP